MAHPFPTDAISLVKDYLLQFQNQACKEFEAIDGKSFITDEWERPLGGGGISKVLENGHIFSKACVNFSHVQGNELPPSASLVRPELAKASFHALGVSIVLHPHNPFVPTSHANVRFFIAEQEDKQPQWWFGGGFDLTPYYGFEEDCQHWHLTARDACLPFGEHIYPLFKNNCDNYFFLKHRNEARGIGGLFFDDFVEGGFENAFNLMKSISMHFLKGYVPIVNRRKACPFTEKEKAFQLYRRGRYVEFNLVYDRGTLFGLQSGGRTESILLSLPPEVHWLYDWRPLPDSAEEKLYTDFLPARDWISGATSES